MEELMKMQDADILGFPGTIEPNDRNINRFSDSETLHTYVVDKYM